MTSPVKNQIPYVYSYNSDENTTSNSGKTHNKAGLLYLLKIKSVTVHTMAKNIYKNLRTLQLVIIKVIEWKEKKINKSHMYMKIYKYIYTDTLIYFIIAGRNGDAVL